jgi:hypothetical protein
MGEVERVVGMRVTVSPVESVYPVVVRPLLS